MVFEVHEGYVNLHHTFDQAWDHLRRTGELNLDTARDTPFTARAAITSKGKRSGDKVIRFLRRGQEYARSYDCCWGHYYNCYRTRIGMYCRALDAIIP